MADNLIVFYAYKAISLSSTLVNIVLNKPDISKLLYEVLPLQGFEAVYHVALKSIAFFLQGSLVWVPVIHMIPLVHQKNSKVFQTLPGVLIVLTLSILTHAGILLDFQAILFTGFLILSQVMLLKK